MILSPNPTAAILVIGNEILSGRTQDANLNFIARKMTELGIRLAEARVVPDSEDEIIAAVNALRGRYTYVFTTGGIGPTHDDITSACIAKAFGVPVVEHPEARARLEAHYTPANLNEARLRMAQMPEGATLIDNPVSAAPGFRIGNVYVMAGVPSIMKAMMDFVMPMLRGGAPVCSLTVTSQATEGLIASEMGELALRYPSVDIGSYPWFRLGKFGVALVLRGTDAAAVKEAAAALLALARKHDPDSTLAAD